MGHRCPIFFFDFGINQISENSKLFCFIIVFPKKDMNCQTCGYDKSMNGCNSISCQTCCATDKFNVKCWFKKENGRKGCKYKHRTKQKYENAKYDEFPPMISSDVKQEIQKYKDNVIKFNRNDGEFKQRVENKINESKSEKEQEMIRANPTCFVDGSN